MLTACRDGTAHIWDIPAPFNGSVADARPSVEAVTGKAMDEQGVLSWLDAKAWQARREQFGVRR